MAEPEHSKIIARAAKDALTPLGFRRSGRSRVWLSDHGYWLRVVEFQPSGFSKGSYLNVAAHWLWRPPPHSLSFDYFLTDQTRPFIAFENAAQFKPLALGQAAQAARDSQRLAQQLTNFSAIASALLERQQKFGKDTSIGWAGWPKFHAAVVAGLGGDATFAQEKFSAVSDAVGDRNPTLCAWIESACLALDRSNFPSFVRHTINESRVALKLPPWLGDY